jgi:tagatose-1,6-bisphosphate aldolase
VQILLRVLYLKINKLMSKESEERIAVLKELAKLTRGLIKGSSEEILNNIKEMREESKMPHCLYCGTNAENLIEVQIEAKEEGITPEEVIWMDSTYNADRDVFCCMNCYTIFDIEDPTWKAGDPLPQHP